ncbi:MAG: hypothetical protein ACR2NN_07290 [Bryobacteraceae bacterium]
MFDNWQLSGITRFVSGGPLFRGNSANGSGGATSGNANTSLGTGNLTDGLDLTGGGDGWRPDVVGNATLPKDQRTFNQYFNTAAFARPALGAIGNAPSVVARGPGINNWNVSLFKNVSIRERMALQFRAEAYNIFNHTQFSNVNTTPKFDPAGNRVKPAIWPANRRARSAHHAVCVTDQVLETLQIYLCQSSAQNCCM